MKALIGRKVGMTQIFDNEGNVLRVTLIEAGPCVVTQVKTEELDGYSAIQLGFGKAKNQKRPQMGHLKASNANPEIMKEFRLDSVDATRESSEAVAENALDDQEIKIGGTIDVSSFAVGDKIHITGTSKGKGFAGTIKRHNFSRGPKTHGSHNYRAPGSIGSGYPEHVFKGMRMAGQMGGDQVTIRSSKVELIDKDNNIIAVRGAVPGPRKGFVTVRGF